MITILIILIIAMLPVWAFGMVILWNCLRIKPNTPEVQDSKYDRSNRFNPLKAVWVVSRETWVLADVKGWKFLQYDVGDQNEIIEESEK